MVADKGYPMIDLMNRTGFTVSAIGNHEFDLGAEFLNKRFEQANFPFICCNFDATGTELVQPKPYLVLDVEKKIHIAVLGIIELNENGIPDTHPSKVKGIRFYDGIAKAKEFSWLKKKYGILIGLTHLGVGTDERLADSMPEFDEIIGGHSHTLLEKPIMKDGVMIVQDGSNLNYIGETTLMIKNGKVIERNDIAIPISKIKKADSALVELCRRYDQNEEFSKVAGILETPVKGYNEIGSLMADALTDQLKVDIAVQNKGGIRVSSFPQGALTYKDIYKLDPFGNLVVIFRMTESELKSLLTYSVKVERGIDLQISGSRYTVTIDGQGHNLGIELISDSTGKPLDSTRTYTVAMNSYIAASYHFDHAEPGVTGSITTAEILINYLKAKKRVNYANVKRAVLIIKQ
jgi:2',3'-cyclic-nucleotide 2'-phosphodiesterase (5'-nucleotidase family)